MAVQIQTKGGRRSLNAELNLVPFIDLLSVCITFLIATAVWVELSSLPVDQGVGGGAVTDDVPPLTLSLSADGVRLGRAELRQVAERVGDTFVWRDVDAELAADRARYPDRAEVVIVTSDGLPYGDMIHALDLTRRHGYDETRLGGG